MRTEPTREEQLNAWAELLSPWKGSFSIRDDEDEIPEPKWGLIMTMDDIQALMQGKVLVSSMPDDTRVLIRLED